MEEYKTNINWLPCIYSAHHSTPYRIGVCENYSDTFC